jgi:hypothetical protein
MGRVVRPALTLLLALFIGPGPMPSLVAPSVPVEPPADETWYVPVADDFRPHFDRDFANGGKQSWAQYWGWVQSFYQGNLFAKGWSDRAVWLLEGVRSDVERKRLRAKINAAGRDISAEWAKDYNRRKVGTADLLTWGKMLEQARDGDDGSGAEIHRAIDAIREHLQRKVGGVSSR